jgi:[NiFe] hydrogenase assembly HybE family chaperone
VQAVGFRPWGAHWLGVLVTPWFMNLVLLPRERAACHPVGERETRHHVFPAGVFEFIGNRDAVLGDYQACSLFSPMFEFADHDAARATATASLRPCSTPPAGGQRRAGRARHHARRHAGAGTGGRPEQTRLPAWRQPARTP